MYVAELLLVCADFEKCFYIFPYVWFCSLAMSVPAIVVLSVCMLSTFLEKAVKAVNSFEKIPFPMLVVRAAWSSLTRNPQTNSDWWPWHSCLTWPHTPCAAALHLTCINDFCFTPVTMMTVKECHVMCEEKNQLVSSTCVQKRPFCFCSLFAANIVKSSVWFVRGLSRPNQ